MILRLYIILYIILYNIIYYIISYYIGVNDIIIQKAKIYIK